MERFGSNGCKDIWIGSLSHKTDNSGQQFVNSFICLMLWRSVLPTDLLDLGPFHARAVVFLRIPQTSQDIRIFVALNN